MTKTQFIDAIKNIKKRFVSFLSITLIVMLGFGGGFGTRYFANGLKKEAFSYYRSQNFRDYEVVSSLGITQEDLDIIQTIDGVTDVEGGFQFQGLINRGGITDNVQLLKITDHISVPLVLEGTLASNSNECMLGIDLAKFHNFRIGDKINLYIPSLETSPLKETEYIITGFTSHPNFLRSNSLWYVLLPDAAFDYEVTEHAYSHAYVRTNQPLDEGILDGKVNPKKQEIEKELWNKTYPLKMATIDYFKGEANKKIDKQWEETDKQLNDASATIDANEAELNRRMDYAKTQLNEGKAQLEAAKRQVQDGEAQLASGRSQLEAGRQQLLANEQQIKDAEAQLEAGKQKVAQADGYFTYISPDEALSVLSHGRELIVALQNAIDEKDQERIDKAREEAIQFAQSDAVRNALDIGRNYGINLSQNDLVSIIKGTTLGNALSAIDQLTASINDYKNAKAQIPVAEQQIADGKRQIAEGWTRYEAGVKELDAKAAELEAAKKKVSESEATLYQQEQDLITTENNARKEIQDARDQLKEKRELAVEQVRLAREKVEELDCNLVVQSPFTNSGFVDLNTTYHGAANASRIFGLLFIVVGALVCFSTLAMIVEEEKKLVGTTKAFGFHNNEILNKYLLFGVLASVLGSILGILLAYGLASITTTYLNRASLFCTQIKSPAVDWPFTILVMIGAVVLCAIVTILTCIGILRSPASLLMKGDTIGSRDAKLKRRNQEQKNTGSLYSHLIIRNMLDDKARVLVSIIIIAGSVIIMGTGLTLRSSFKGFFNKQLTEVNHYDLRVSTTNQVTEEEIETLTTALNDMRVDYMPAYYGAHLFNENNAIDAVFVLSADPEIINDYISLKDPNTKEELTLNDEGMYVQLKLFEKRGFIPGKTMRLLDNSFDYYPCTIQGVFNNYVGRMVYMTPNAFYKTFGIEPATNSYYIKLNGIDKEAFNAKILSISSGISIEDNNSFAKKYNDITMIFTIIVIVLIVMAILMSFMILTNLVNIFVTRKKKELIVMRINGFSIGQTIQYLARESIVTTIIGLLVGVVAGIGITSIASLMMEPIDVQYVRDVNVTAWVIAVALEAFFAFFINWMVFRKIKDLNFREIL